jgi:hypothetical protein
MNSRRAPMLKRLSELAPGCATAQMLLRAFLACLEEMHDLYDQQFWAIISEDAEFHRFDLLIHEVNDRRENAKYALMQHVEEHGCIPVWVRRTP